MFFSRNAGFLKVTLREMVYLNVGTGHHLWQGVGRRSYMEFYNFSCGPVFLLNVRCAPPPPPPRPNAWRDVIVTDRDEVTKGNERRLLFAAAGGLRRGCKSPSGSRAEPWWGCRAKPPEALTNLQFIVLKRGQSHASRSIFLSEPFWNWNGNICLWCKLCLIVN